MGKAHLWNEGWFFLKTAEDTPALQVKGRKADFIPVDIPHDWLIYDSENLYENGTGWYRKEFEWAETDGKKAFVTFEGIYMDSTVYINEEKAGEWKYGYSSFTIDITDYVKKGKNEVLVSVRFISPNSRWYSGAGIYRDVWFQVTEKTYLPVNGIYISTKKQGTDFELLVETEIAGERAKEAKTEALLLDSKGKEVPLELISAEENMKKYLVRTPLLWDVEQPVLYTLKTALILGERKIQEEEERFGFRYTEFTTDKGFFLNGRHLKLNGVCEHHDLGCLGAAFNAAAMKRKFRILKEMGVNAVRGTHNMMAPGFVRLADEMGILLISEAFDMWERQKTAYDYGRFFGKWWKRDVESWVKRDRNHPSVIMWSIGNEIYDTHADERGQEITSL